MYGISQNPYPYTNGYIIVLQYTYCETCGYEYANIFYKWCKQCQIEFLKANFKSCENQEIDGIIQVMQLRINDPDDIVFEWIPYDQFSDIKIIGKDGLDIVYSAIWKDGPLHYNKK